MCPQMSNVTRLENVEAELSGPVELIKQGLFDV